VIRGKKGKARSAGVKAKRDAWRAAREPEVLKAIGRQSKENGTDTLTSGEIDRIIREARADKKKR
jgi:hypothetical protein